MARQKADNVSAYLRARDAVAAAREHYIEIQRQRHQLIGRVLEGHEPSRSLISDVLRTAELSSSERGLIVDLLVDGVAA